ncbi:MULTISPECIES: hypothetical protein [Rhodococcus]|uniref:hypothetical protein n=1 Tax=Rhodococcus TaxID=1827 RepID=UPI0022867F27|nr:hypothetical protein [Rhodococcus sp. JS3073]WAM18302.1 hypothetical protein OYT95_17305 [Rhodococcus sp. JS3073]
MERSRLSHVFEKMSVMHSTPHWAGAFDDLAEVLGPAGFSDGRAWAKFPTDTTTLCLSDETDVPSWCLLGRTHDVDAAAALAREAGWTAGEPTVGDHECRVVLRSPHGLTVIAYSPLTQ